MMAYTTYMQKAPTNEDTYTCAFWAALIHNRYLLGLGYRPDPEHGNRPVYVLEPQLVRYV